MRKFYYGKEHPKFIHGMSKTKDHRRWISMLDRCYNPTDTSYKYYGAKGIGVCEEWKNSFMKFYEDMGPCPENHSLDRIDVTKNYSPENCKWSTRKEQNNNRNSTIIINYNNEKMSLKDFCKLKNLVYTTIWRKLKINKINVKDLMSIK